MSGMTLPSKHRIRNSNSGGLRPSTPPLGHGGSPQYWVLGVDGEETFCFFQTAETGNRTLARKAAVLTTTLGPPHERKHIVHPVEIYASRFNLHSTRPPLTWYKHVKWNHSLMYYNCTPPPWNIMIRALISRYRAEYHAIIKRCYFKWNALLTKPKGGNCSV